MAQRSVIMAAEKIIRDPKKWDRRDSYQPPIVLCELPYKTEGQKALADTVTNRLKAAVKNLGPKTTSHHPGSWTDTPGQITGVKAFPNEETGLIQIALAEKNFLEFVNTLQSANRGR